jgi:hypothetical protein
MHCSVYPTVNDTWTSIPGAYYGSYSVSNIPLLVQFRADSGDWKNLQTLNGFSDSYNDFTFKAPANKSYLEIRVTSDTWSSVRSASTWEYGVKPGNFNNGTTLPPLIYWGKPFTITADPVGGIAKSCTFFSYDTHKTIASAKVVNGHLATRGSVQWAGAVGQRYLLTFYVDCKFGSRTYSDVSQTYGIR